MNATASTFRCHDCGAEGPAFPEGGGCSNYILAREGSADVKVCPGCADVRHRAEITGGASRTFGYLGTAQGPARIGAPFEGVHGKVLGRVVHVGREVPRTRWGPYGVRYYVRVRLFDGSLWHGTGAPGMWCPLRRSKGAGR